MTYLIKVTIVWAIFLLLFELLYKKNKRFTANRIYLLSSVAIGLLLPLIPVPSTPSFHLDTVQHLYTTSRDLPATAGMDTPSNVTRATIPVATGSSGWSLMLVITITYIAGAAALLIKYLSELFKIAALCRKPSIQISHGYKLIDTGRLHSPYSFLNYIFLTKTASINPKELEYIIRHEAAHYTRKHWLDLWMLQVVNIVFWFHPLLWRYRHLLQLQHEYEADTIAAHDDPYTYGHFILQQTMLRGVPSLTHSFHFSPIKNRIDMLTKINNPKSGNRMYLLLIPVLLGTTLLAAKPADKSGAGIQGNKLSYKGNILTWRQSDTLFYDKAKGHAELIPANTIVKQKVIVGVNDEPVYRNDYLQTQASYGSTETAFADYAKEEFHKLRKNTIDSFTYLVDLSVVVDKGGKVVYFNAHYARPEQTSVQQSLWNVLYPGDTHADKLLEEIISNSPLWKPALNEDKTVNSYVTVKFPGC